MFIGSSLSRVSSSSPSSTPTDSDSHTGPQMMFHASHSHTHSLGPPSHNSVHEEEIAPPIASRPERTKSIVSVLIFLSVNTILNKYIFFSIRNRLKTCRPQCQSTKLPVSKITTNPTIWTRTKTMHRHPTTTVTLAA